MEVIQSRQNPLIKICAKLAANRRERLKSGLSLLDGPHLIVAALDSGHTLQRIFVAESAVDKPEVIQILKRTSVPHSVVTDNLFSELSELESVSGILAIWRFPMAPDALQVGWVLALDGVQDPGNVGSILRTAVAAGVQQVWLSPACADVYSPKVLRAGMGAHFLMPIIERADLPELLSAFNGQRAVTALDGSISIYGAQLTGSIAMVMGSEGMGVSQVVLDRATLRLRIPMQPGLESLNVGAAAAICLYERVRQLSIITEQ